MATNVNDFFKMSAISSLVITKYFNDIYGCPLNSITSYNPQGPLYCNMTSNSLFELVTLTYLQPFNFCYK